MVVDEREGLADMCIPTPKIGSAQCWRSYLVWPLQKSINVLSRGNDAERRASVHHATIEGASARTLINGCIAEV